MASMSKPSASGTAAADAPSRVPSQPNNVAVPNDAFEAREQEENLSNGDAAHEDDDRCMLSELPRDVLSHVMSLQAHADRLSVATTSSEFLKKVEEFSKLKFEEIAERADTTFVTRIKDKSAIAADIPDIYELPYRYLLWKAQRTHLYALDTFQGGSRAVYLDVSADGSMLVVTCESGEAHGVCQMWNLATKQCIKSIEGFQNEDGIERVVACEDYIVVHSGRNFSIWNWNGQRVLSPAGIDHLLLRHNEPMVMYENKLYFSYPAGIGVFGFNHMATVDLATGDFEQYQFPWSQSSVARRVEMVVSGDVLLVLRGDMRRRVRNNPVVPEPGIFVFDLREWDNFPTIADPIDQFLSSQREIWSIVKASHKPNLFATLRNGGVDIFLLQDGQLTRTATINLSGDLFTRPRHTPDDVKYDVQILVFTESQIFIHDINIESESVKVYSTLNGQLLRKIELPGLLQAASANERELFLGFDTLEDENPQLGGDDGPAVRVYCLEGY